MDETKTRERDLEGQLMRAETLVRTALKNIIELGQPGNGLTEKAMETVNDIDHILQIAEIHLREMQETFCVGDPITPEAIRAGVEAIVRQEKGEEA